MIGKRYKYKGKEYLVIDEVPFKHPETREWIPGFLYMQLNTGLKFVRDKEEFLKLFK